jgi:hypothetical protein
MNTKINLCTLSICLLLLSNISRGQATLEITTRSFVSNPFLGPSTSPIGPISFERDLNNNNQFSTATGLNAISAIFTISNQSYTGLSYANISTGLVFGASPTTANSPLVQQADPSETYNVLGSFNAAVGGPTNNMFTSDPNASPTAQSGTGIVCGNFAPPQNGSNGAVGVFTAAQVLFDQPGGPAVNNSSTRYYYGNLVITFSRFVSNPVIHIAGLGGSYRYFPVTGTNANDPLQWRSCFFSTELEVEGNPPLTRMSGNQFFSVSGNNILNNSLTPNGASVNTVGGLFNEIGAASGSVKIDGPVRVVTLRVYLRGSDASQFPWSASQSSISGANRNPFTGDVWWVSASSGEASSASLPVAGVNLTAVLNSNDVLLKWKTETEINSSHFEIERSTDGRNFSMIGTKAATGNSVTTINYDQPDPGMNGSIYYYRLKLVDTDGRSVYSNIAMVRKPGNIKSVRLFPNPAVSQVNLEFSNAKGSYVINVYNQTGQEVISQKNTITNGVQYVTINRNSLAGGSYFIRIRNTENAALLFAEKIILQ